MNWSESKKEAFIGHGESLGLIDLLRQYLVLREQARLWSDAFEGLSLAPVQMTLLWLFAGSADPRLDQLLHKGDLQKPALKGRPRQQNVQSVQYTTIPIPCMFAVLPKATNPFQIQHFLRPDGIRKAISTKCAFYRPFLEKRN
jgi:hypothetical protein